jgi:signal transduction histidine kinase
MNPLEDGTSLRPPPDRADGSALLSTEYGRRQLQSMLSASSRLPPNQCLDAIAKQLRSMLNCETVCILRWREEKQQLITEHRSGMPKDLKGSEVYSLAEGITGKFVFNHQRRIVALVDFENEVLTDVEKNTVIEDESVNWINMRRFRESSRYAEFRSLLSVPLNIRDERIGVIKLINKIGPHSDVLSAEGFTSDDLNKVDFFLSTIQQVLEAKRHDEQIHGLVRVSESVFQGRLNGLHAIAAQCIKVLNYRICAIRLNEPSHLIVAPRSLDLGSNLSADENSLRVAAMSLKRTVRWKRSQSTFESEYGAQELTPYKCPAIVDQFGINAFVVVPILRQNEPIGTIECYATVERNIGEPELSVLRTFVGLVNTAAVNHENIENQNRLEVLREVFAEASRADRLTELYDLMVRGALKAFRFDYCAISTVDDKRAEIKTISGRTQEKLVDPAKWQKHSRYSLTDTDILPWIVRNNKAVVIDGPKVSFDWDDRLNREIFERHGHEQLVRILVPLNNIERVKSLPNERRTKKRQIVIGVIEAGFHVSKRRTITTREQEQFKDFISSFAEHFQRVRLIEERKNIERIRDQLGREEKGTKVLAKLLELSVNLVGADAGAVMLLSHSDNRLTLGETPILYNLTPEQRNSPALIDSVEIKKHGRRIGLVAYAAANNRPYWSNDVENESMYLREFDEVKSEMVIPLTYSGEVIGVLDIYSYKKDHFDSRKVELLSGIADPAVKRYEKARISSALASLANLDFNPFSEMDEIYEEIVKRIVDLLDTKTVAIWEVDPAAKKGRELKRVQASNDLEMLYKKHRISHLPIESFTGAAASKRKTITVSNRQIRSSKFRHSKFARKNNLKSMTAVPIAIHEAYATIDIFSRRDTELFQDEISFVQALADRAAGVIFGAKLKQWLERIAGALAERDINKVLDQIIGTAVDLLHASPVILLEYDASRKKLLRRAKVRGALFHEPILNLRSPTFFNWVIEKGDLYLTNERKYLQTLKTIGQPAPTRTAPGFWNRERIKSSAGRRLVYQEEIVGILWLNYRSPRVFDRAKKNLFEGVASLAASAIANARLSEQTRTHQALEHRYSLARTLNAVATGLEHTSGNYLHNISLACHDFEKKLGKRGRSIGKAVGKKFLEDVREPLTYLVEDFEREREFREFGTFKAEKCKIEDVIEECRRRLRRQLLGIRVEPHYRPTPVIFCDKNQIRHALTNLLMNSCEALDSDGTISITTAVTPDGEFVMTRIEDNGPGIPRKFRTAVFEPFFTTKEKHRKGGLGLAAGGSGLGLSVSRFIAERHGGSLRLDFPRHRKGTIAKLFLPIGGKKA